MHTFVTTESPHHPLMLTLEDRELAKPTLELLKSVDTPMLPELKPVSNPPSLPPLPVSPLMPPISNFTAVEYSAIVEPHSITESPQLDIPDLTGSSRTHGVLDGEKVDTSD